MLTLWAGDDGEGIRDTMPTSVGSALVFSACGPALQVGRARPLLCPLRHKLDLTPFPALQPNVVYKWDFGDGSTPLSTQEVCIAKPLTALMTNVISFPFFGISFSV